MTAEPHWPAFVALVAIAGLFAALPANMLAAPSRWLLAVTVVALLVPTTIAEQRGNHYLNQVFGYILNGVVTAALIVSLAMLLIRVIALEVRPEQLLRLQRLFGWLTSLCSHRGIGVWMQAAHTKDLLRRVTLTAHSCFLK